MRSMDSRLNKSNIVGLKPDALIVCVSMLEHEFPLTGDTSDGFERLWNYLHAIDTSRLPGQRFWQRKRGDFIRTRKIVFALTKANLYADESAFVPKCIPLFSLCQSLTQTLLKLEIIKSAPRWKAENKSVFLSIYVQYTYILSPMQCTSNL